MIKNKLSRILGEKRLKITQLSKETGIFRTTLTAIYYDRSEGISFGVLEKLCKYFNCKIEDLFEYKEDNWNRGETKWQRKNTWKRDTE